MPMWGIFKIFKIAMSFSDHNLKIFKRDDAEAVRNSATVAMTVSTGLGSP